MARCHHTFQTSYCSRRSAYKRSKVPGIAAHGFAFLRTRRETPWAGLWTVSDAGLRFFLRLWAIREKYALEKNFLVAILSR